MLGMHIRALFALNIFKKIVSPNKNKAFSAWPIEFLEDSSITFEGLGFKNM